MCVYVCAVAVFALWLCVSSAVCSLFQLTVGTCCATNSWNSQNRLWADGTWLISVVVFAVEKADRML